MQRHALFILGGLAFALLLPCSGFAAHNPADYPLRVHIFNHTGYSHYYGYNGARSWRASTEKAAPIFTKTRSLAHSISTTNARSA